MGVLQGREGVSVALGGDGHRGGRERYGEVFWCGVGGEVVWVARE